MSDTAMPVPPPTFEFLVLSIKMQVEMQLGLMNLGDEEESQADLVGARHAIDMLGMLQDKTKGNLTSEEQRLIENSLTELRFRFVQASQAPPPKPAESMKESAEVAASPAENAEGGEAKEASGSAEPEAETPPKESAPRESTKDAKPAAKKGTDDKDEESGMSSSGIRVTDRRSGKSSAEE